MPANLSQGNCQYTAVVAVAGTSTLNNLQPNPPGVNGPPLAVGVFYGMQQISPGTGYGATVLDIIVTGTGTTTNTLATGTGTALQQFLAGPAGLGVRYRGSLVVITVGTPGIMNVLWD